MTRTLGQAAHLGGDEREGATGFLRGFVQATEIDTRLLGMVIALALVWLGFYNGANDGDFGKRTRYAIVAWQRSVKATPDGVLGPTLLQALTAAADKARAEVGFKAVSDPKTGARIGAPTMVKPSTLAWWCSTVPAPITAVAPT